MHRRVWLNLGVTVVLLLAATFSSLVLGGLIGGTANAQMLFLLAVLLIARFTDGYLWGVGASIVSVPLVNYMFTYPYFSFNLTISGYLLTFLTMLAVSLIVSVLTARIKQQEQIRLDAEREKLRANLLRAVSHDLRTPLTSIVGATGAILDNALPPEKQRICSSLTGPQNGTTFTLSSAPSAAGVLPGSGRWNGKETSSVLWEPTRWQMVKRTWPAARPWKLCGAKASAGGSSSRWRMPSPPKAGCLSSCAAPSGCISIPGWALRRWESMHDMKYNNN